MHGLRYHLCSTLERSGTSVDAVCVLAGHSSLAITQRYVHATGADMKDAISKLPGN
jgi:site-specific recombinase XerD